MFSEPFSTHVEPVYNVSRHNSIHPIPVFFIWFSHKVKIWTFLLIFLAFSRFVNDFVAQNGSKAKILGFSEFVS